MAKKPILGLFETADNAADAGDALKSAGVAPTDFDFLTDAPYPEGAFGEREENHRLYIFPFVGALIGLTVGIMLTSMTQWPIHWSKVVNRSCRCHPWLW